MSAKTLTQTEFSELIERLYSADEGYIPTIVKVAAISLSFCAGLRVSEIARLRWRDVMTVNGTISDRLEVRAINAKYGAARNLPMSPRLKTALLALHASTRGTPKEAVISHKGRAFTPNALAHVMRRSYERLGYVGLSSHSGRRSLITAASRVHTAHSLSLKDIQLGLAGHKNLATTERYIDRAGDLASMIATLY